MSITHPDLLALLRASGAECPITLNIMEDPVTADAPCGCTFSREGAMNWYDDGHLTCPGCGADVKSARLKSVVRLRELTVAILDRCGGHGGGAMPGAVEALRDGPGPRLRDDLNVMRRLNVLQLRQELVRADVNVLRRQNTWLSMGCIVFGLLFFLSLLSNLPKLQLLSEINIGRPNLNVIPVFTKLREVRMWSGHTSARWGSQIKNPLDVGGFNAGKRHGHGTMRYHNGVYTGSWKNGKRHGRGTMHYANGASYEGEWKEGWEDGQGTHKLASGHKYMGGFKASKWNGVGILLFSDGIVQISLWEDGLQSGEGVRWNADQCTISRLNNGKYERKINFIEAMAVVLDVSGAP